MKSIGILGCGWLGLPLARSFISEGYLVHGSTTTSARVFDLEKEGIRAFRIQIKENGIRGDITAFLQNIDTLIINVPPRLRAKDKENYVKKMALLHSALKASNVNKVVFVSSTSVYGHLSGEVTEKNTPKPATESGKQLLAAEYIFKNDFDLEVAIIRFGGLIGANRHPVSILSGKTALSNGDTSVNLIHLDDCIAIIKAIVLHQWWNEIFNAVYPLHPIKRAYYSEVALKRGILPPHYGEKNDKKDKIIIPFNLVNVKKYRFKTSIVG